MDFEAIKFWFQVLQFLATAAVGIYVYLSNKNKVTNERISKLQENVDNRLDDHSDRLARVEQDVRHAPTHEDLKRIHGRMDEVVRAVSKIEGEFIGTNHTLRLIHEHLLNAKGDR